MPNKNNITELYLSDKRALQIIREVAKDTSRIQWTDHALKRMKQRKITTKQVLDVLNHGIITEGPARSTKGDWQCKIERFVAGDNIAVVVAIDRDGAGQPVIIITIYNYR